MPGIVAATSPNLSERASIVIQTRRVWSLSETQMLDVRMERLSLVNCVSKANAFSPRREDGQASPSPQHTASVAEGIPVLSGAFHPRDTGWPAGCHGRFKWGLGSLQPLYAIENKNASSRQPFFPHAPSQATHSTQASHSLDIRSISELAKGSIARDCCSKYTANPQKINAIFLNQSPFFQLTQQRKRAYCSYIGGFQP